MFVRTCATRLACAFLAVLPLAAAAQTNTFDLLIADKPVGKATYTLNPSKTGFNLDSHFKLRAGSGPVEFTEKFRYTSQYGYADGSITDLNTANNHASFVPNKTATELDAVLYAGGGSAVAYIPIKPGFVVLTPFDPGSAQAMLLAVLGHPSPDGTYTVVIPGTSPVPPPPRRSDAPIPPPSDNLDPATTSYQAKWIKGRDTSGTLDGKPVTLHSYLLAYRNFRWVFYADDANSLMSLSILNLKATCNRANFKLDPVALGTVAAPSSPTP